MLFSISLVSRCVPDPSQLAKSLFMESLSDAVVNKTEAVVQRQQSTQRFLEIIELDDVFQKFLSDIYIAWRQIVALCGISVGKNCVYFAKTNISYLIVGTLLQEEYHAVFKKLLYISSFFSTVLPINQLILACWLAYKCSWFDKQMFLK